MCVYYMCAVSELWNKVLHIRSSCDNSKKKKFYYIDFLIIPHCILYTCDASGILTKYGKLYVLLYYVVFY